MTSMGPWWPLQGTYRWSGRRAWARRGGHAGPAEDTLRRLTTVVTANSRKPRPSAETRSQARGGSFSLSTLVVHCGTCISNPNQR